VGDHVTVIPDYIIVAALNLFKSVCNNEFEPYVGYFTPAEIMCALSVDNSDFLGVLLGCVRGQRPVNVAFALLIFNLVI
jgi:hypothetical protein